MWPLFFYIRQRVFSEKILIDAFLIPSKHIYLVTGISSDAIQHFRTRVHYVRLT
jgi:hypothetical protein